MASTAAWGLGRVVGLASPAAWGLGRVARGSSPGAWARGGRQQWRPVLGQGPGEDGWPEAGARRPSKDSSWSEGLGMHARVACKKRYPQSFSRHQGEERVSTRQGTAYTSPPTTSGPGHLPASS